MERWAAVSGYEGLYEVSDAGRVRSLPRNTTSGRIMKAYVNNRNGYAYVCLNNGSIKKTVRVHRLVADAFIPNFDKNKDQVNHKDGVKTNNSVENLEWCTQSENMAHAFKTGLERPSGLKVINTDTMDVFESASAAARSIGGKHGEMVARVCRGERSHYRNHHFAFLNDYLIGVTPEYKGKTKRKGSEMLWR